MSWITPAAELRMCRYRKEQVAAGLMQAFALLQHHPELRRRGGASEPDLQWIRTGSSRPPASKASIRFTSRSRGGGPWWR